MLALIETADVARTLTAVQTTAVQTTSYRRRVEAQICASPSVPDHREAPPFTHLQSTSCPRYVTRENLGKNQWRTRGGGEDLCQSIYCLGISKGPNLSSNSTRLPDWIWAPTDRIQLFGSRLCGLRDLNSGRGEVGFAQTRHDTDCRGWMAVGKFRHGRRRAQPCVSKCKRCEFELSYQLSHPSPFHRALLRGVGMNVRAAHWDCHALHHHPSRCWVGA